MSGLLTFATRQLWYAPLFRKIDSGKGVWSSPGGHSLCSGRRAGAAPAHRGNWFDRADARRSDAG